MKVKVNYNLKTDEDLSKFLLVAINDVRSNEIDVETATAISQLADKYIKNEIMRCIKTKMAKQKNILNIDAR